MLYPMKLTYVAKSPIWGGRRLTERYGKEAPAPVIGETWELTVRPDEMSRICNGIYAGRTLGDYIDEMPYTVRAGYDSARFPLLIKFIDAADRLSVQVHPDDLYAARVEHDTGKTEMWYIIEAEPGAELVYGLADGVSAEKFSSAVAAGEPLDALMHHVPVSAGEVYFLPSGLLHAIGRGILLAEIQQNSDLTYRVYDYGRLGTDGKPRELHREKAADVVRAVAEDEIDARRYARGKSDGVLAACPYFTVTLAEATAMSQPSFTALTTSFVSLLCFKGAGLITCAGVDYPLRAGDSYFIPAGCGEFTLSGDCRALVTTL